MEKERSFAQFVGEWVRESRAHATADGMTQAELCRGLQLCGVDISEQSYSMKERGEVNFSVRELFAIALFLGFSCDFLMRCYIHSTRKILPGAGQGPAQATREESAIADDAK